MSENRGTAENHTFSIQNEKPSIRIMELVAEVDGVDTLDLPPLFDVVDPESLDAVVQSGVKTVSFEYAGYTVQIKDNSEIVVQRAESS